MKVGAPADLTVFAQDPRAVPKAELLQLRVVRTVVGGQLVYSAAAATGR